MNMIKEYKYPMPTCEEKGCKGGIHEEVKDGYLVQKICKKCEEIERDMIASTDYEVLVINGRAVRYNIVDDPEDRGVPTLNDTMTNLHELEAQLLTTNEGHNN